MAVISNTGQPPLQRRVLGLLYALLKGWVVSFLIFGSLAALTVYAWTTSFTDSFTFPWEEVARRGFRDWMPWALAAPVVFQVTSWLPIFGNRWKVAVPTHVFLALGAFALCGWWAESGAVLLWPSTLRPLRENRWQGPRRPPETRDRSQGNAEDRPQDQRSREERPAEPRLSEQRLGEAGPGEQRSGETRTGEQRGGDDRSREQRSRRGPDGFSANRPPNRPPWPGRPPSGPPSWWRYYEPFFLLTARLPIYLAILSVSHALVFYRRSQARERRSLELESGLARARLDALRMQLQPHFLFNSLNAIAALIHKDPEAADEMVAALSDFLRLTLESSAEPELPLGRELEFVERYLAIEKVRFGDRLKFAIDTPPETLPALVPTLVLQPLVENAVRHGLEPKIVGGTLTITARHEGADLVLRVVDDGVGFHQSTNGRQGIGLVNTRARLSELYGSVARLEMRNGDGVSIEITLPFHTVAAKG